MCEALKMQPLEATVAAGCPTSRKIKNPQMHSLFQGGAINTFFRVFQPWKSDTERKINSWLNPKVRIQIRTLQRDNK
jgi:hypothetical protein